MSLVSEPKKVYALLISWTYYDSVNERMVTTCNNYQNIDFDAAIGIVREHYESGILPWSVSMVRYYGRD